MERSTLSSIIEIIETVERFDEQNAFKMIQELQNRMNCGTWKDFFRKILLKQYFNMNDDDINQLLTKAREINPKNSETKTTKSSNNRNNISKCKLTRVSSNGWDTIGCFLSDKASIQLSRCNRLAYKEVHKPSYMITRRNHQNDANKFTLDWDAYHKWYMICYPHNLSMNAISLYRQSFCTQLNLDDIGNDQMRKPQHFKNKKILMASAWFKCVLKRAVNVTICGGIYIPYLHHVLIKNNNKNNNNNNNSNNRENDSNSHSSNVIKKIHFRVDNGFEVGFCQCFNQNKDKYNKQDIKQINSLVIEGCDVKKGDASNICDILSPRYQELELNRCEITNATTMFHSNLSKFHLDGSVKLKNENNNINNNNDDNLCKLKEVEIDYAYKNEVNNIYDIMEMLENKSCLKTLKSVVIHDRLSDDPEFDDDDDDDDEHDQVMLLPMLRNLFDQFLTKRTNNLQKFCIQFYNVEFIRHIFNVIKYFINNVDNIKYKCLYMKEIEFSFDLEPEYIKNYKYPDGWIRSSRYKTFSKKMSKIQLTVHDLTRDEYGEYSKYMEDSEGSEVSSDSSDSPDSPDSQDNQDSGDSGDSADDEDEDEYQHDGYPIFGTLKSMWYGINAKTTKTICIKLQD